MKNMLDNNNKCHAQFVFICMYVEQNGSYSAIIQDHIKLLAKQGQQH